MERRSKFIYNMQRSDTGRRTYERLKIEEKLENEGPAYLVARHLQCHVSDKLFSIFHASSSRCRHGVCYMTWAHPFCTERGGKEEEITSFPTQANEEVEVAKGYFRHFDTANFTCAHAHAVSPEEKSLLPINFDHLCLI